MHGAHDYAQCGFEQYQCGSRTGWIFQCPCHDDQEAGICPSGIYLSGWTAGTSGTVLFSEDNDPSGERHFAMERPDSRRFYCFFPGIWLQLLLYKFLGSDHYGQAASVSGSGYDGGLLCTVCEDLSSCCG